MDADAAASKLVERVRARPWGLATVAIVGDDTSFAIDPGVDPMDEDSIFDIGSITKTMTGVLLADSIMRGETSKETTLGEALGFEGGAATVTLEQLATQRSGLPRMPANFAAAQIDPADPYASYGLNELRDGLATAELGPPTHVYSNFGFMALGAGLSAITGQPLGELFRQRLFDPLGMKTAACPPELERCVQGYDGSEPTPWWSDPTPGAGGVGTSIRDIAAYLRGHIDPPDTALGKAIGTATTIQAGPPDPIGYGWVHLGGGWWHNGGTRGFHAFAAFVRDTRTGVALLANCGGLRRLDEVGFKTLTELTRTRLA